MDTQITREYSVPRFEPRLDNMTRDLLAVAFRIDPDSPATFHELQLRRVLS